MMPYAEWWQPDNAAVCDAEAATEVMGWRPGPTGSTGFWVTKKRWPVGEWPDGDPDAERYIGDFSPCTDRNATDLVLAEMAKKDLGTRLDFEHLLIESMTELRCDTVLAQLRLPVSLLVWAAVMACTEGSAS